MKKVCIIFGYYNNGIDYFSKISSKKINYFDEIFGFEALSKYDMKKEEKKLKSKFPDKKIQLENKGIWIHDRGIDIYIKGNSGSSVLKDKKSGEPGGKIFVPTTDIKFFLSNFNKEDTQLYMSMNIEGSEFEILEYMFEEKIFENINIKEFYLDNHTNIKNREKELKDKIKNNNIKLMKFFKGKKSRPLSGNPEDYLFYN